jgi:hypothetical protein
MKRSSPGPTLPRLRREASRTASQNRRSAGQASHGGNCCPAELTAWPACWPPMNRASSVYSANGATLVAQHSVTPRALCYPAPLPLIGCGVRVVRPDAPASPPSSARFASLVPVGGTARLTDDGSAATHAAGIAGTTSMHACTRPPCARCHLILNSSRRRSKQ